MPLPISIALFCALVVAMLAAVSDHRSGEIPNWITLPPVVLAPVAYGATFGFSHGLHSLTAAFLSAVAPYLLFRRRAMGGGDVKLFAALGALTGFDLLAGLEIQLAALCVALVFSLGRLAWNGTLIRTLVAVLGASLNPILPRGWRRDTSGELLTPIRMGASVLIATGLFAAPGLARLWDGP